MSEKASIPPDVKDIFPYEDMRESQKKGIPNVKSTAKLNGFLLLEGACGTGKTMLALSAYLSEVRDSSSTYTRVMAITSVKQQLKAFEEAVCDINEELPESDNVTSLTLTGKSEMHPYVRTGEIAPSQVYEADSELRESTRELVQQAGNSLEEKRDFARELYKEAEDKASLTSKYPYPESIPTYSTGSDDVPYNPYYARYLAGRYSEDMENARRDAESVIPFNPERRGAIDSEKLFQSAALENGISPSSVMDELMDSVDVVIANYAHVFDEMTVDRMTSDLISHETAVIVDEGHNLVPRVRDALGEKVAFNSLKTAADELEEVIGWISGETSQTQEARSTALGLYNDVPEVSVDDMRDFRDVLEKIHQRFGSEITNYLDDSYGNWRSNNMEEVVFPLRDPEKIKSDRLTQWINLSNNSRIVKKANKISKLGFLIRSTVYEKHFGYDKPPDGALKTVGTVLDVWFSEGFSTFFRQISLSRTSRTPSDIDFNWEEEFRAKLEIKNCLPKNRIADKLDKFGCGTIMSATLEPFEVFRAISGIDELEDRDRPIMQRRYGLNFPESNRKSLAVKTELFSSSNRGSPMDKYGNPNVENKTREEYSDLILDVVETTSENIMVVMPNYKEAKWAGRLLEHMSTLDSSQILIDTQSEDRQTENLKQDFFDGDKKILCTGAFGTLTEGVDYDGDKLKAAIVCGVPLENPYEPSQKAIRTAYKDEFGRDNDFEYAFSLPAVYKTRQAVGRVIRSSNDKGVRIIADKRYTEGKQKIYNSVRHLFPEDETEEFDVISPDDARGEINKFWN